VLAALVRVAAVGGVPRSTSCFVIVAATALALTGCGQKPFDATPEGVAREFVTRMDAVRGESKDARAVFDLLSRPAQTNLSDRARRASAAAGKRIAPEQMIAPALFYPHFQPQKWATRAQGIRAIVEIQGIDPSSEHASIPCVLEDGHWRVDLVLPHLPPIERHERNDR
jgi:predicted small lipoprotein YifL